MASEAQPRVVGIANGVNAEVNPLVQLNEKPLDRFVIDGAHVLISGAPWASINGKWFAVQVSNRPLSQFRLLGVDTSGEQAGTGAPFSVRVRDTYAPT